MTAVLNTIATPCATPGELACAWPCGYEEEEFVARSRACVRGILDGEDDRLLIILGPCSLHDEKAAYEYAEKVFHLSRRVEDRLFLVMRGYFEKPRTSKGWKGFLYDPFLDGSCQLEEGLIRTRRMLVNFAKMRVPIASELLEISTAHYFSDLLTWGCIGARTVTSQPHRQLASSLEMPIGFKNTTDGGLSGAIHGIVSAKEPHVFLGAQFSGNVGKIQSRGNGYGHLVLRGGERGPNYEAQAVRQAEQLCRAAKICPRLIVDCAHDNCGKRHEKQQEVFESVGKQIRDGTHCIAGMMLESHLFSGNQSIEGPLRYGVSVTDPCLDWKTTERLINACFG